jgi:hypothetical protein
MDLNAENVVSNLVNIADMSDRKAETLRRVGSLLNKIEASVEDLSRFNDIEGVAESIQALVSLQSQISEKFGEDL